ncbi:IclR family transcriptional regulator C-terminal domain-containing protein [Streptomyces sp. ST2-7A]|uniref:IclR family transcriptional regulator domain-containing protein n=1 Tax=Streptomyces sp. ST2-7A TaxID=2907214 RepID=UPI001F171EB6|nr:IclR family transcriptional regulator C-terminal domain-containing protein [Streptomyces sp. ST2-7A]MCE7083067.1 helix-turn-helix domain-containing protein [Streptomyces sp. ST2-7A]
MSDDGPPAETVGPFLRGLAVLGELAGHRASAVPAGELARATGIARSTLDRTVGTLAELGLVRVEDHRVTHTGALALPGNAFLASTRGLSGPVGAMADALAEEVDESVALSVPDGDSVRLAHLALRRRVVRVGFRPGDRLPVGRAAAGVLLTPGNGSPGPDGETGPARDGAGGVSRTGEGGGEPGLVSVAVQLSPWPGEDPVGALSVVSHRARHDTDSLRADLLPRMRECAAVMEERLRSDPGADGPHDDGRWWDATALHAAKERLGAEFVESLARGPAVIAALETGRHGTTPAAVSRLLGLPRASVRRALFSLRYTGHAVEEAGRWRLTPRVLGLGHSRATRMTLADIARPHLVALAGRVGESASLTVPAGPEGAEIRYVARVATERIMSADLGPGTRFPAYPTASGRVLLAGRDPIGRARALRAIEPRALTSHTVTDPARLTALLDEVARDGYAMGNEELEVGLRSIAVPVRNGRGGTGEVVAAVNLAMPAGRRDPRRARAELLPALRRAVEAIERELVPAARLHRVPTD